MSSTGLSSAVGARNARCYLNVFNGFENADGAWRPSWNWAALLCSTGWFFYRRMFVWGTLNLALLALVALPLTVHLTPDGAGVAQNALVFYAALMCLFVPAVANWLYYRFLQRRVAAGSKSAPDVLTFSAAALASAAAAGVTLYALAIATATDFEVRVHVVDAMLAVSPHKQAVEAFVKQHDALPATRAELPPVRSERLPPGVKLAEIVPGGSVRLAFGGFRHINGRSIEFAPTLTDTAVQWQCFNIDMPEKELPVQCRSKRPAERKAPAVRKAAAPKVAPATPASGAPEK